MMGMAICRNHESYTSRIIRTVNHTNRELWQSQIIGFTRFSEDEQRRTEVSRFLIHLYMIVHLPATKDNYFRLLACNVFQMCCQILRSRFKYNWQFNLGMNDGIRYIA